jgi:YfiH family protein
VAIRRDFTSRLDGDFRIDQDPAVLVERRVRVVDLPWVWLRQVHGADVVTATRANAAVVAGTEADAVVTAESGVVLAIHTADCVPVLLRSPEGVIGAAHAGWKGLEAGVVGATVETMRDLGASDIAIELGPYIRPECYEFGIDDLDRLAASMGEGIRGTTAEGTPALDVRAAVEAQLQSVGVVMTASQGCCTACQVDESGEYRWFSHRARGDAGRQAAIIWIEP